MNPELQTFGIWRVQETLKPDRCYLATFRDVRGVVKVGRGIENEAYVLKQLEHPNIVKLLDYDLEAETPYIVTEYHEAETYPPMIIGEGTVPDLAHWLLGVGEALAYCIGKGFSINDFDLLYTDEKIIVIDFEATSRFTSLGGFNSSLEAVKEKVNWMFQQRVEDPLRQHRFHKCTPESKPCS